MSASPVITPAWLRSACSDDAPATLRSASVGHASDTIPCPPPVLRVTCPSCHGDSEPICGTCSGSGEGMYDGSRCPICHGRGDTHVDCETCGGEGEIDASCEDCGEPATMRDPHEDYLCAECYASRERDDAARMEAP